MSFTPLQVLCRSGCGNFGDDKFQYHCYKCHEMNEEQKFRYKLLQQFTPTIDNNDSSPKTNVRTLINHEEMFEKFLQQPREKDANIIDREIKYFEKELEDRRNKQYLLQKYMLASEINDPEIVIDSNIWIKNYYQEPKAVPELLPNNNIPSEILTNLTEQSKSINKRKWSMKILHKILPTSK